MAIEDYSSAIQLERRFSEAYYSRGRAYADLGQLMLAIGDYGEAIRLNAQYGKAYAARALAFAFLHRDSEARRDADRAIDLGTNPELREVIDQLLAVESNE